MLMIGLLYINDDLLGAVDFKVIDESMGGIGGELLPTETYNKYKRLIQDLVNKKGIANIEDFNFKIVMADNTPLKPEGGIGVTDCFGFDEIFVEAAGLDLKSWRKLE